MKKLFFLFIALVAGQIVSAQTSLGKYLMVMESNLNRTTLASAWTQDRDSWQTQCQNGDKQTVLLCIARLEGNINRDQLSTTWESQRGDWLQKLKMASDEKALAALLMQLKDILKPEAFSKSWADVAASWTENVKAQMQ